jgi:uncharacterized membrane protein (DUF485 family)
MGVSEIKTASRGSFSNSHLIIIIFHFIIACFLIFNGTFLKGDIRKKIFWIGIVLGIASILAVVAVYIYYRHNVLYVINNENL